MCDATHTHISIYIYIDEYDVTENISTFARRHKLYICQTPWVRFNIEPLMASNSLNT